MPILYVRKICFFSAFLNKILIMSYVIQNYFQSNLRVTPNIRFKLLMSSFNLVKLFSFFRFNFLFIETLFSPRVTWLDQTPLYQMFFVDETEDVYDFDKKFYLEHTANFKLKLYKTLSLYCLTNLINLFLNRRVEIFSLSWKSNLFANAYFFPIKILFISFFKKVYKTFFFWIIFNNVFQWDDFDPELHWNIFHSYYFSFLKLYYFVNKRFFKIYNM